MDEEFCLSEKLKGRDIDGFVLKDVKEFIRLLKEEINGGLIADERYSGIRLRICYLVDKLAGKELSNGN